MNIKQLLTDDEAVSPVIGVILMVAITVILAAVIGTFVLGIGQDQQTVPQATFDFSYDSAASSDNLTVTHTGGDTFTSDNSNSLEVKGTASGSGFTDDFNGGSLDVSAGDTYSNNADPGTTVRVLWTGPGGDKTQTVADFDVPD